jgi:hypothetical protein
MSLSDDAETSRLRSLRNGHADLRYILDAGNGLDTAFDRYVDGLPTMQESKRYPRESLPPMFPGQVRRPAT